MPNRIPVKPEILKWARETAGYSLEEVAVDNSLVKVADWELGNSDPTYSQLEKLSQKYHRPVAVFFFPKPPKEEGIRASFRTLSDAQLKSVNPTVHLLFRKAKAFQVGLRELFEGNDDAQRSKLAWMKALDATSSIFDAAWNIREKLGVSVGEQESWKDSAEALANWREILAENGVFVFKEAFRDDSVSGFCIYDPLFPVVFINNSQSKNRQIFTVFHEIAHLLLKHSYLDISDNSYWELDFKDLNNEEARCNAFSAAFLVPSRDFLARTKGCSSYDDDYVASLASSYHVSREVVWRLLLNHSLIEKDTYQNKIGELCRFAQSRKEKEFKSNGGNYFYTKAAYLGNSYISTVLSRYYQGRIDLNRASSYLDIKTSSFSGLEAAYLKSGGK